MTNLDELPEIRRSQTIAPFGIGAIYEWSGESFVACDTTMWGERGSHLELDRLARSLKIAGFRQSPERTSIWKRPGDESIPYMRFPQWHFCPNCRKMDDRISSTKIESRNKNAVLCPVGSMGCSRRDIAFYWGIRA